MRLRADLIAGMPTVSLLLFVPQQPVPKAAGMGECVWLQESAAVQTDGRVVPATPVSLAPRHFTGTFALCGFVVTHCLDVTHQGAKQNSVISNTFRYLEENFHLNVSVTCDKSQTRKYLAPLWIYSVRTYKLLLIYTCSNRYSEWLTPMQCADFLLSYLSLFRL